MDCPTCEGQGGWRDDDGEPSTCDDCGGTGKMVDNYVGLPLPPGCAPNDFTGCSHDALLDMVHKADPTLLKHAIMACIRTHGATANQRALLQEACEYAAWFEHGKVFK